MPSILSHCKKNFKHIIPQIDTAMVISVCKLMENIMKRNEVTAVLKLFIFAVCWCVGGGYSEKDGVQYKKLFADYFKDKFKSMNFFKGKGSVFDFFIDFSSSNFEEWNKLSNNDIINTIDTSKSIQSYTIPTVETISAYYLMKQFIQINHCCLLVGQAGCGKTQITKGLLNEVCG